MTDPSATEDGGRLARIYRERFSEEELAFKQAMWRVVNDAVFQNLISPSDAVLDLGAGTCEFINAIRCGRKIAVDLNPDVRSYARDAQVIVASSSSFPEVPAGSVDVVFSSNLFEHLRDKDEVLATLAECRRVLHPGARIIIVMPNVRYLPGRYWDYFDHHTPLTHHSMAEALAISGFETERVVPRFLPYTMKHTRLPRSLTALRLYVRMPLLWRILGKQMLIVARRPSDPAGATPTGSG